MIEVRDLVKRYGRHLAVDHLSFTVPDGQIFGFLGPNGAGKSTTMNLMTGYLGPTEGEILVDGQLLTEENLTGKWNKQEFVNVEYALPESMLKDKQSVTVMFRPKAGNIAGGVFGVRLLK